MKNPLLLESYETEADLNELLIKSHQEEGTFFEFKESYTGPVANKLGKHVAAFANWHGGLLAIGVKAIDGVADSLPGIEVEEGFQDSVSQKIASTVITVPIFRIKLISVGNQGRIVLLIKVEESVYPPHLFEGKIYIRPAAQSDPIHPENTAQIDQMYQKRLRIEVRIKEAVDQTWYRSRDWPNPCVYLIACPLLINKDLIPDFNSTTLQMFREVARFFPTHCGTPRVAANEFRCRNTDGDYDARMTRYGLIEVLLEKGNPEADQVFSLIGLEEDTHVFLQAVKEAYTRLSYFGHFNLILGVKQVQGKTTACPSTEWGGGRWSQPCELNEFVVEREVSLFGEQNVVDYDSRKRILEGMAREYLAHFGVDTGSIETLVYLGRKRAEWRSPV